MSSTSGGPPTPSETNAKTANVTPRHKKRKADELSPLSKNEAQEIVNKQLELRDLLENTMKEVSGLMNTLSTKTKIETREFVERLNLLTETIETKNLLDCLGYSTTIAIQNPTQPADIEMDQDEFSSSTEEVICSRCKKEIVEEQQIVQQIRNFIEEIHVTECEHFNASDLTVLNKKWPEDTYIKSKTKTGNPLTDIEEDVLLALKTKNDHSFIQNKFEERYPGLKDIIDKELVDGQTQFLENITKTKSGIQTRGRVYVMCGESIENQYKALKELENEAKENKPKKISIVAADEKIRANLRKLVEIVFLQTSLEIDFYVPKKESRNIPSENKYDTIMIKSAETGKSYSDMLKSIRDNIDPENLGINIKNLRKMKNDALLIVTEKTQVETLKKVINENDNLKDVNIIEKKCDLLITGMDAVTTKEEVLKAIEEAGTLTEEEKTKLEIKHIYLNRSEEQVATVTTTRSVADKVTSIGYLKIGWTRCRIKEKFSVPRCTNCLRIGHMNNVCKTKRTEGKKCLKCTQVGHEAKDCLNTSHCNSCAKEGHRADSMSCPKYRKKVYEKEKSITS